ncbi:5-oxoprolinase subunit PxpB [Shewanella sp. AS1]|uniref:5-oxoprolinase subunit PxpB n=1 Tax=Shewanella sp. AS1 TaxID=2907626 RepID=UPI001F3E7578|nr:5-oxoprolinase subunit PxpB [Shewanella sp. AS1]MCE9678444.1 5-oxoprolinase subunit PxpB [Shewanella sp. AS1]
MKVAQVNENSVIVYFSDTVSEQTADSIASALPAIRAQLEQYVVDIVPSYTSILISVDLLTIGMSDFCQQLEQVLAERSGSAVFSQIKTIELPVYYGAEVALDAETICEHTGLTFQQVVDIHSSTTYRVYAIGFAPGFAYLGNTDERIAIPRKQTPRLNVPAGSLALADRQTAIYPKASPGGWQVIGRTPLNLIDFERENLSVFEMGAQVRFKAIDRATFLKMGGVLPIESVKDSAQEQEGEHGA